MSDPTTTGEWTPENISEKCGFVNDKEPLAYSDFKQFVERICETHNAALAAEREASKKAYTEGWHVGRDFAVQGRRDTAANPPQAEPDRSERDWSDHLRIQLAAEVKKVNKLQEQLAAERKKREKAEQREREADEDALRQVNQLREQLAAEREKRENDMKELRALTHATIDRLAKENQQLCEQLAAVVEALKEIKNAVGTSTQAWTMADAALAKIGRK